MGILTTDEIVVDTHFALLQCDSEELWNHCSSGGMRVDPWRNIAYSCDSRDACVTEPSGGHIRQGGALGCESHWGQTPVFLVRTFREHCQEMHNLLRTSRPRTLQGNPEFTSQFTDTVLSGTHTQYIQNVPGHVTAVFPLGKLWENSGFTK